MLLPSRQKRSPFDLRIIVAYLTGTTAGALGTALAAWTVSGFTEPLPERMRVPLLAAAAVAVWALRRGAIPGLSLPESRRQIPAEVFAGSIVRGAFRFGLELGTGLRTYVPALAPYVLLLVLLIGRPTLGAALLIGFGFGLGRAVPLMVQFARPEPLLRMGQLVPARFTSPAFTACILSGGFLIA